VDNLGEPTNLDAALEAWLEKDADVAPPAGASPSARQALRSQELEVWQRFKANPNPQDFKWLYQSHQPLILSAQQRELRSTTLPKAAVRSDGMRQYIVALNSWDPSKGAFSTHLNHAMQHNQRYLARYQNVGRIPEERAQMIGLFQNRLAHLRETLKREPSNTELADDMRASLPEVAELSRKMQKITPRTIGLLRREVRRDLNAEAPGGEAPLESSALLDHIVFLHGSGSLTPEQEVVLEHTVDGFGKPVIQNAEELAPVVGMSPQKIRALRKQIAEQAKKYYD
jgi:hypothetical protein